MAGTFKNQALASVLMILGYLELWAMIFSAVGLVVVAVLWVIASAMNKVVRKDPGTIRLFDQSKDKRDDPQ